MRACDPTDPVDFQRLVQRFRKTKLHLAYLLVKMMAWSPLKRPSAKEALGHYVFDGVDGEERGDDEEQVEEGRAGAKGKEQTEQAKAGVKKKRKREE